MSAVRVGVIPEGAPSAPHWMVSVRSRGNIHQRMTLAPAAFIFASPSAKGAGLPSMPARPHEETPPKSPAKLRHAQFAPYMKRVSHFQVTPAPFTAHASGTHSAPVPGSVPVPPPEPSSMGPAAPVGPAPWHATSAARHSAGRRWDLGLRGR